MTAALNAGSAVAVPVDSYPLPAGSPACSTGSPSPVAAVACGVHAATESTGTGAADQCAQPVTAALGKWDSNTPGAAPSDTQVDRRRTSSTS